MNIRIEGEQVLSGEIKSSGYKNSALALIASTILFDKPVRLKNVPQIVDVEKAISSLQSLGAKVIWDKSNNSLEIDCKDLKDGEMEFSGKMRGEVLFWGPLLARFKRINFTGFPGGCTLGYRSLTPHIQAFKDMGVSVKENFGRFKMKVGRTRKRTIFLLEVSPTATENLLMFCLSIEGVTKIVGASADPQVQDLCQFFRNCGARINGVGSSVLEISGGIHLSPRDYEISPDDHEVATFLAMGAVTGGGVKVRGVNRWTFEPIRKTFESFGVDLRFDKDTVSVPKGCVPKIIPRDNRGYLLIKAQPWPGLMVDNLPLFIPLALASKKGQVVFHNWMYEAGLFWVSELQKLGANIIIADPHRIIVSGGKKLRADVLEAPYIIRAVVAMVMSAMIAKGETVILNADSLYRGHPYFAENLKRLGAKIEEIA